MNMNMNIYEAVRLDLAVSPELCTVLLPSTAGLTGHTAPVYVRRIRDHVQAVLQGHEQEVCGLRWSINGQQLASGGNDNLLHVWAAGAATGQAPSLRLTAHSAAVKALAWCPFQSNLLASGGGTADRCIRFWNSHTGALLNSIDTNSQVCTQRCLERAHFTCKSIVLAPGTLCNLG